MNLSLKYNSRTLKYDFNNLECPPVASVHPVAWNGTPDEESGDDNDMSILIVIADSEDNGK